MYLRHPPMDSSAEGDDAARPPAAAKCVTELQLPSAPTRTVMSGKGARAGQPKPVTMAQARLNACCCGRFETYLNRTNSENFVPESNFNDRRRPSSPTTSVEREPHSARNH